MKPAELQAKLKTLKLGGMMLTLEVRRVQGEAENVLLVGDSGTGKTMIAIGLGVAACEQGEVDPPHHRRRPGQRALGGTRRAHPLPSRGTLEPLPAARP